MQQPQITWPAHDVDAWGVRLLDGQGGAGVRRLADVVRLKIDDTKSTRQAAAQVVGCLADKVFTGYLLNPDGPPVAITEKDVWWPPSLNPDQQGATLGGWRHLSGDSPWVTDFGPPEDADGLPVGERGQSGMLQCLWDWVRQVRTASDLDCGLGARVAVADALAAELAGTVPPIEQQRSNGVSWTNEQRESAFRMRHKEGKTGIVIGQAFGVTRQRVDQMIGTKKLPGTSDWQPSAALCKECGLNVSPLQSVAADLQDKAHPQAVAGKRG